MKPVWKLHILIILLPLCWLIYNNTANWHYHYDDAGNPVKHAHPLSASGDVPFEGQKQDHEHTSGELYMLAMITDAAGMLFISFVALHFFLYHRTLSICFPVDGMIPVPSFHIPLLRAPPDCLHPF